MFKRIVMQVSGLVMVRFTTVYIQLTICLSRTAKHLLALITQTYHSVLTLLNPLAKMLPNFKAWAVNPTTVAPSTKQGRSTAKAKVTRRGSQRQTTAPQTRQRATISSKKSKGFVVKIRLALLRISESKTVQTLMAHQWIQGGLKLLGTARQRLKHVQHRLFKGR